MNKARDKHKPLSTGILRFFTPIFLVLILIMNGCALQKERSASLPNSYIAQSQNSLIYDATFRYKDFLASGLLVLKRIQPSYYHVVLLSKFGPTIMEFKLDDQGITWIKSFDQLNKKTVEKVIERDFRILLLSVLEAPEKVKLVDASDSTFTYKVKDNLSIKIEVDAQTNQVIYAENKGFPNPFKTIAQFTYKEKDIPQNIAVTHKNINLRIDLNLLKIDHAER